MIYLIGVVISAAFVLYDLVANKPEILKQPFYIAGFVSLFAILSSWFYIGFIVGAYMERK